MARTNETTISLERMIKMFDRNGFMNWLEETFITNSFGRNIVSEIIEYAYEHQNVSLDQFAYFVSDLLPELHNVGAGNIVFAIS